jgi:hypothetical protein
MINTLEKQYVLPRRTPEQQYAHTNGISGAEALQSSPAALLVLSELNVLLKQQYVYNLEDLEQLELEARTSPVTQWQSLLKEVGYTHEQISSARQALRRTWGIPEYKSMIMTPSPNGSSTTPRKGRRKGRMKTTKRR